MINERIRKRHPLRGIAVSLIIVILLLLSINTLFIILPALQRSTNVYDSNYEAIRNFYLEEDDSLDGLYVGPSSVYRFWLPPLAYEDTGMAVYALSCNNMPISTVEFVLKDAVRRQNNIKFIAIDMRNISKTGDSIDSHHMKRLSDSMPNSSCRTDAINAYLDYCEIMDSKNVDYTRMDYYFPFLRDHGRWLKNLNKTDLLHYLRNDLNLTFKGCQPRVDYVHNEPFTKHVEEIELKECQTDVLNSLFSYCRQLEADGISVIFTFAPCNTGGEKSAYLHETASLCQSEGFTVLDFNDEPLVSEIDFDYSRDFYDNRHASYTGGEKYTKYMTEYFKSHFDLPDHRGDPDYASWYESVEQLKQHIKSDRIKYGIE